MAVVLAVTVGAQAVSAQAATAAAINSNKLTCQQVAPISVTLSPTDPTPYTVAGQLCAKGQLKGKTMQLLVHGLTYDHRYWDWPQTPQNSYVRSATDDGYATLAIDRIGDGASSHPADGNSVTTISSGYVIHQIVQKLRSGAIGGNAFHKIIAVGHSFGAASVGYEAGTYHDVDGVIISGFMHDSSPTTLAAFSAALYPASLDPQFANSGLNNTYLTTLPGTRAQFFFNSNVDPAVITKDEQIKQTGTTGELDPGTFEQVLAATTGITVPVFITMG
ncbi:MAG TPA: alpha/beta hydrolase, partial [Candidatus Saccharimonadales bacterium]|nr:alpha/beta hydrolase [Candidatus Saccharimonadales bacterium]